MRVIVHNYWPRIHDAFEETKHPRVTSGSKGGQFTSRGNEGAGGGERAGGEEPERGGRENEAGEVEYRAMQSNFVSYMRSGELTHLVQQTMRTSESSYRFGQGFAHFSEAHYHAIEATWRTQVKASVAARIAHIIESPGRILHFLWDEEYETYGVGLKALGKLATGRPHTAEDMQGLEKMAISVLGTAFLAAMHGGNKEIAEMMGPAVLPIIAHSVVTHAFANHLLKFGVAAVRHIAHGAGSAATHAAYKAVVHDALGPESPVMIEGFRALLKALQAAVDEYELPTYQAVQQQR
jgi:hypothetical protein